MFPKLIIFDLDGTLLNTLDDLANSVNHILEKHGYPTHSLASYKYFVGDGITKLIERALPIEQRTERRIAAVQAEFVAYYALHDKEQTAPYEGISPLLEELKKRHIQLAVASNKHHSATLALVEHFFGKDSFTAIYGKREGIAPKPHPQIVFDILQDCERKAQDALYVGDSSTDMLTAENALIDSVGVTWGFREREELAQHRAKYIIDEPLQLLDIVQGLKE